MKSSKRILILLFCCFVWAGKPPTRVSAQVSTGDIVGVITDQTGSIVPNGAITLKNTNTGSTQATTSGTDGGYTFSQLPSGTYEIAVTAPGFNRAVIPQVVVRVGTRITVDIKLEVGNVATSVEVTAAATMVKHDDIAVGQIVTERSIVALPLNGRNYLQLANLSPGMSYVTNNSPATDWTGRANLTLVVAGIHEADVSFLLDGIETRSTRWGNTGFRPSVDAIEEFNVQRNALTADQGVGLTVVNTVLRSGTNNFHGTAFEFIRNEALDARNFFDPSKKPPYKQNQYGFTLGGPIRKEKLFFFGNYEGYRQRLASTAMGNFPTPEELQGVFPGTITDPQTGEPFDQNTIPQDRFDPIAKNVLPYFPQPNSSTPGFNYSRALSYPVDTDQFHIKVDLNLPHNDRLFVRYSYVNDYLTTPSLAPGWGLKRPLGDQNAAVVYTHIFSPTVVNVLRLGYNRDNTTSLPESAYGPDVAKDIGLQNTTVTPTSFGLPGFSFTGWSGIGQGYTQTQLTIDSQFEISDNLSLHRGKHDIKVGTDIRRDHLKFNDDFPSNPSFSFYGTYSGDAVADFLLGLPAYFQWGIGDTTTNYEKILWTAYVQDNYRVRPNMTLYFGLRYEYDQPPTEINDRQGVFDLVTNQVLTIRDNHLPRGLNDPDKNNWGPRLGFAYTPFSKTVVRGAVGAYYGLLPANEYQFRGILNPPFYYIGSITNTVPTPTFRLQDQFPALTSLPTLAPNTINLHDRTPYVYQYNFNIQHEFRGGFLVEAGYVGDTGHKLNRRFNNNIAPPDPTVPLADRRPHPGFSDILTSQNDGNSIYNGFNLRVDKPMAKGFLLLASYTLGKELNIGDYAEYIHRTVSGNAFKDMRGPSEFDQRQRLTLSYVYRLPFGKGQTLLSQASGPVNKLVSGWELSGITTFASGQPRTPSAEWTDWAHIGGRRVDPGICVGPLNNSSLRSNIRNNPTLYPYFNVENVVIPAEGTMGNCGRGVVTGPGLNNWDVGLMKETRVTERFGIQFRAETFNTWNHAQFGAVVTNFLDPNFGRITWARAPRDVQFGLKLIF